MKLNLDTDDDKTAVCRHSAEYFTHILISFNPHSVLGGRNDHHSHFETLKLGTEKSKNLLKTTQ